MAKPQQSAQPQAAYGGGGRGFNAMGGRASGACARSGAHDPHCAFCFSPSPYLVSSICPALPCLSRLLCPQALALALAPAGCRGGALLGLGSGRRGRPTRARSRGAGRGSFAGRGAAGRGRGYGGGYGGGYDGGWGGGGVYEDAYMDDGYGGYGAAYGADAYGGYGGYGVAPAAGALVPMVLPNGQVRPRLPAFREPGRACMGVGAPAHGQLSSPCWVALASAVRTSTAGARCVGPLDSCAAANGQGLCAATSSRSGGPQARRRRPAEP